MYLLVRSLREDDLAWLTRAAGCDEMLRRCNHTDQRERQRKAERTKGIERQGKEENQETSSFRALPIRNDEIIVWA